MEDTLHSTVETLDALGEELDWLYRNKEDQERQDDIRKIMKVYTEKVYQAVFNKYHNLIPYNTVYTWSYALGVFVINFKEGELRFFCRCDDAPRFIGDV